MYDKTSILNNLQQVVFEVDLSSKLIFLNSSWENLTDYSVDETLGTNFLSHVHPKDRPSVEKYLYGLYQQGKRERNSVTVRFISKHNRPIFMVLRANPVFRNKENSELTGIIGTLTDIAGKIRQQKVLEAKYRSLRNFVDSYSGMLYRCRNDQNLTIEYASTGCLELTGYSRAQLVEKNEISYASIIHPDDRQRIFETIQYKLHSGEQYELTHRIITAEGVERWVFNRGKGNFSSSDELLSFQGLVFDFDKQKKIQERSQQQLLYDSETKLLNRILFIDRLGHSIEKIKYRNDYAFTLLLLSIDQYSQLFENLGAQSIEFVITEIGQRIIETLNYPVSLCRLQDDHFGILLDSSQYSIKNITAIMNQIQEQVQAPLTIGENEVYVTASIGVVIGNSNYDDKDKVLAEAQNALSRAISLGGARYEMSDLVTHGKAALQTHIEKELGQALEQNEFLVYWQPIVTLKDNQLSGLEARLVWPHPIKGLLYAEQFVPSAEETQLITPLWEWMINDVCRQIKKWNALISEVQNISLNIQVTGATLLDADVIFRLCEKLLLVKPDLCNLVVGVSENVLSYAPRITDSLLKPMEGKDIKLLLDGYGCTKTSLSLLQDMPIDYVRLSDSIIENCLMDRGKFIRAIASLTHNLDIEIVANAVQSKQQLEVLKNANIDSAQGNCISKPISEDNATQMLSQVVTSGHWRNTQLH